MNAGDALVPLERAMTLVDMVAYAGATWDWHRLHYEDGVVDGQMLGALMAKQLSDQFGPDAFITSLGFRLKSMVHAGDSVRIEGSISSVDGDSISVTQRVLAGERLAAEGTATVRL